MPTSALQGAFRHAEVAGQVTDSIWFDRPPEKATENESGTIGGPFVGAGEQMMDPLSVDVLEDGQLQGTDVTNIALLHAGCGNRHFVGC